MESAMICFSVFDSFILLPVYHAPNEGWSGEWPSETCKPALTLTLSRKERGRTLTHGRR